MRAFHFTALIELPTSFDLYSRVISADSLSEAIGKSVVDIFDDPDYKNAKILKVNAIQIN